MSSLSFSWSSSSSSSMSAISSLGCAYSLQRKEEQEIKSAQEVQTVAQGDITASDRTLGDLLSHTKDLTVVVFSFLDAKELSRVARVSRNCDKIVQNPLFWYIPEGTEAFRDPSPRRRWFLVNPSYQSLSASIKEKLELLQQLKDRILHPQVLKALRILDQKRLGRFSRHVEIEKPQEA